jgi:hypothetical protein
VAGALSWVLALACAGCELTTNAELETTLGTSWLCPEQASAVADTFARAVLDDDTALVNAQLLPETAADFDAFKFVQVSRALSRAKITRFTRAGCKLQRRGEQSAVSLRLDSDAPEARVSLLLDVVERDGKQRIVWFEFGPPPSEPPAVPINRLCQALVAGCGVFSLCVCVVALVLLWRTPAQRRRWAWALYACLTVSPVVYVGATSELGVIPFHVVVLGFSLWGDVARGGWDMMAGFPIGALHYLFARRRSSAASARAQAAV